MLATKIMTQTKNHCSTPDQLLTFLRGQLSAREEAELQQHLDDCVLCRERLESTAADASVWNEAKEFFANGALHASTRGTSEEYEEANQGPYRIRQVLDSLGPTDDPESLGRIGGYEVTGVIGAGGMGVVLKAHDRSLDRIVAIKVMSPHLASSGSARKRFAREAKAAAAVLHPNVIAIHSVASEDANPYLVMPFVRGASLQKRIDSQGPLPLKDTLRIGAQIAAGLAAAHEQGLVHRDIKPANILLEEGVERVTITDFGLARAVDDASMTCSGVIAGTPQYMSPEQARGEPIDARSDLFSLGGVLHAMCTGRSPFRAETTFGVLHRIANDQPTPVCEVNSDTPVWLGHIIDRLMAKRPEDRFESAAQVAELLEGCLAHVQQPAAMPLPEPVVALAPKKTRRPPIGKFIAAAAGACALLFAGVLIVLELSKGTLTIESELDNVPIRIMQGDKVVEKMTVSKSGNSVRVAAGTYVVELNAKLDDIFVENDQVSLKRGTTEHIVIRHSTHDEHAVEGVHHESAMESHAEHSEVIAMNLHQAVADLGELVPATIDSERASNAVKRVMQYLTAVKEKDSETINSIAKGLRKHEKREKDMATLLSESGIPKLYKTWFVNSSAVVALGPVSSSDKQMNGRFLLFTLSLVDERWSITDIDLVVEERLLERFKNPIQVVDATPERTSTALKNNELATSSKSTPEFPPVKIVVHDEEGKPCEGVKISLYRVAKDQGGPVLEINEISTANGLAVNRSLPYGHYDLSARTSDGWVLHHGSRLNVEFEKGLDVVLVAPTASKMAKLVVNSDLGPPSAAINELRFGELQRGNGPGYSVPYAPEPVAKPIDGETETTNEGASTKRASPVNSESYDSFPSIVNGIEYVGAEIDFEITRSISQAAMGLKNIHPTWEWYPTDSDDLKRRYLVANNQARGLMDDKALHLSPVDASQFFELPGPSYRVGASRLELGEPTALPMELDIPAGDVKVYIGRFYGKPNAAALAALNWRQQEKKSELWLKALIFRESAWIERLMNTTGWVYSAPGEGSYILSGHLLRQEASVTAGETLKISLNPKPIDPKTSSASAARVFNARDGSSAFRFESPEALQGEWEYVSFETDGVTTEYKTLEEQQRTPRLKVAGDRWTVPLEDGVTVFGSGLRVEVDGNKLTFYDMTPMMAGLGSNSNNEIPTIGYGLWQVDGDTLTYLMTPAVAESALNGQSKPPIKYPDSFATKGTENSVFRLRRIQASTPPTPSSSTNQTQSKSSIVGHWKVAKLAHLPANELKGATVVIDKGTIKMHVPSQKGPHPHWRYTTGADGEIDLNEFDDAKGDTTSYAKFLLEGKTLYLAVNAKKGDYPRPESARGEPQDGVLYIVLELDELASSTRTVSATDRGDEKLDGMPEVPEQPQLGKTLQQLQGKWRLSRQIAADGDESMPSLSVWEFKGDRVIVRDGGPGGAMLIEVDDSQSPVHVKMTIEIDKESGLGLLSLEGDKVILCLGKRQKTPDPHSRPEKLQWVAGVFYMELIRMKPGETVVPSKPSVVLPMDRSSVVLPMNESAISPLPVAPSERHAVSIDHGNARSVVEAYVASALAGDVAKAASLAKNSPADPKRIRELPEFLNVQRLKIETVYINDPAKPTQALATSVAVKLDEEHKNPGGRRDGFMVLTLEFTDEKWFVIDIDFQTESGAEKELNKFLKANPNSIGIPP